MQTLPNLHCMTPQTLSSLLLSPTSSATLAIIDVRDSDYVGGHIRSSLHVPFSTLDYRLPELVRTLKGKETVVFHCALSQQRGPGAARRYLGERGRMIKGEGDAGEAREGEGGSKKGLVEDRVGKEEERKEQEVWVLDGGFVKWQESYGTDKRLTEDYAPDVWNDH